MGDQARGKVGMSAEMGPPLKLIYMGTADFAVPALEALAQSRHEILAVYTQPARPAGRGMRARSSPIERTALTLDLPVLTPITLKGGKPKTVLASLNADLAVVAAYGLILPETILATPRLGCINLHGSCLPRWRGAAPIQRSILAGDQESGVTIIQMDKGLDTGPILAMESVQIGDAATAKDLHDRLASLAASMIVPMMDRLAIDKVKAEPQPEQGAVYAHKIEKAEEHIDWTQSAVQIDRQIRALNPWPGCWTELDDQRLRVLAGTPLETKPVLDVRSGMVIDDALTIACGEGAYRITRLQRAGGKPMASSEFLRGCSIPPATQLGASCLATN